MHLTVSWTIFSLECKKAQNRGPADSCTGMRVLPSGAEAYAEGYGMLDVIPPGQSFTIVFEVGTSRIGQVLFVFQPIC